MKTFDITDFGAVPDGQTLNTHALQSAAEACRENGGGTLLVPEGTFLTGAFELFSGTTLLVEKGGRLLASPRLEDHMIDGASVGLLFARDARDIVLTGEGTLDGNAGAFFVEGLLHGGTDDLSVYDTWQKRNGLAYGTRQLIHGPLVSHGRPGNMLIMARCRDVRMENLNITGASYWTIHCADCENVAIDNLRINNDLRYPNNDGIHLTTCRNIRIRNCDISCGDDSIAITGFREAAGEPQIAFGLSGIVGVCENIDVSDCTLTSHSSGVRIGYGQNPVRNVHLNGLDIRHTNRGIGIFARQADAENIVIENCRIQTSLFHGNWWGRGEPIHLSAVRFPGERRLFSIREVTFRNIEANGENAVLLFAEEPGAIDQIKMISVQATMHKGDLFEAWGGNLELRPIADSDWSIKAGGTAPLWAIGVSHFECMDCQWNVDENAAFLFSPEPIIRDNP